MHNFYVVFVKENVFVLTGLQQIFSKSLTYNMTSIIKLPSNLLVIYIFFVEFE